MAATGKPVNPSIARQLECQSVSEWWQLIEGRAPTMAAWKMSQEVQRSGKPFREVLLKFLGSGALIMVNEQDRLDAEEAVREAGEGG
jgi:hypothetical protein